MSVAADSYGSLHVGVSVFLSVFGCWTYEVVGGHQVAREWSVQLDLLPRDGVGVVGSIFCFEGIYLV